MTKRAGKRKNRMGSQRHPPGPITKPPTVVEDNLPPQESLALERMAIERGWLLGPEHDRTRELLLRKLASLAAKSDNAETVCKIVRTISNAEQRQQMIEIARQRANRPANTELPSPINVGVTVNNNQQGSLGEAPKPFEVIQSLIAQRAVRDAASPPPAGLHGPIDADQACSVVD